MSFTEIYEGLPRPLKLLLQFLLGAVISGIYRVFRYIETKKKITLIIGILCLLTGGLFGILWITDFITELFHGRVTVFTA